MNVYVSVVFFFSLSLVTLLLDIRNAFTVFPEVVFLKIHLCLFKDPATPVTCSVKAGAVIPIPSH